jgi:hypothetical protein
MRPCVQWIPAIFLLAALVGSSPAAIVLLKDRPEPVVGSLVHDDKDRVVLRTTDPQGKSREETFKREEVEEVVPAYSTDRLAALDPGKPASYRDYAEELRARRRDPEARDMAIRLYLIAAWLDREHLGRSALLGMVSLARSTEEEKKFRAALYVIDPRTPLESLQTQPGTTTTADDATAAQDLLRALRMLRTGKGTSARAIAEKPAVTKLLETYSRVMTKAEFNAAAGQATLNPRELRQTLLLELEIDALLHPGAGSERSTSLNWSRELQGEGGKAVPSLSLETLTEFDPRKCVFREGKWEQAK